MTQVSLAASQRALTSQPQMTSPLRDGGEHAHERLRLRRMRHRAERRESGRTDDRPRHSCRARRPHAVRFSRPVVRCDVGPAENADEITPVLTLINDLYMAVPKGILRIPRHQRRPPVIKENTRLFTLLACACLAAACTSGSSTSGTAGSNGPGNAGATGTAGSGTAGTSGSAGSGGPGVAGTTGAAGVTGT